MSSNTFYVSATAFYLKDHGYIQFYVIIKLFQSYEFHRNTHFTCWRLMASYVAPFLHSFKESIERVWFSKCRIRVSAKGKIQCLNYNASLCTALLLLHEMIFLKDQLSIGIWDSVSWESITCTRKFCQKVFFLFLLNAKTQQIQHKIWQIPYLMVLRELIFGWVCQLIQQKLKRSNIL